MIKKHIITCTAILGLLVMAKVFTYNLPQVEKVQKNIPKKATAIRQPEKPPISLMEELDFANEALPLGDKRIERKMRRILADHSHRNTQTNKLHRKANEWFPVIEPILAKYGIPEDFKYMPLVESGVKGGVSPKGAAGTWQFMPATARMYGLKVNGTIDERYNLRKSTIAAAKYLKELHKIFGNWTLVAAAYNVGDGTIRRQMNRQNQDNYFKMKLNRETAGYVYKLISMKEIIDKPVKYGYTPPRALLATTTE